MFSRWCTLNSKKSIMLQGPRRVGKSTLLKHHFPNYNYVTLDDLDDLAMAKNDPKAFVENLGKKFIIDEAQRVPELSLAIKKVIDQNDNSKEFKTILTGSTGLLLKDQLYDTLAGRIDYFKLPTCCFGEQYGPPVHKLSEPLDSKTQLLAKRKFESFFSYGGFPEVINCEIENETDNKIDKNSEKESILKNYKNSYFTRDLAFLLNLENIEGIKAIFGALIKGIGSRYEISALAHASGLSVPTTKKYFNSLLSSGLSFKLYGYHLGPAKRYIAKSKNYFLDQGILFSLSDEYSKGQALENFVISEIEKRRQLGFIDADELFYYESVGGAEIDLVIEERKKITLIEIKSAKKLSGRDMANINAFKIDTKKELKKIIIYLGDEIYQEKDIICIPAWNFFRANFI